MERLNGAGEMKKGRPRLLDALSGIQAPAFPVMGRVYCGLMVLETKPREMKQSV